MTSTRRHYPAGLWAALIFCATLVAYAPVYRAGFVWNDEDYVTRPALNSLSGLGRIWFEIGATQQYYPALHSAFWVEHHLWGDAPLGYHLANVLLHAAAACLFALVLRRLAIPGAWFGGFVFALHPICAESVGWISEQKNTLSAVFYLLSVLYYLRFDEQRGQVSEIDAGRRGINFRDLTPYLIATGFFLLAILSKSVVATLPAALLVILWWRRGRISWRDALPLLPWFGAAAADGALTAWFERHFLGAVGSDFTLNLAQRTLLAGRIVWFYLGKILWPADLIFIYPRWDIQAAPLWEYAYPVAALAGLLGLWLIRNRARGPLATALFFVGSLFPTLGFLSVFGFLFSYVADHWVYLPALGVIAFVSAGWGRWARRGLTPFVSAACLLAVLGSLTWRQSRSFSDVETLYRSILDRNPAAWMAHNNLGIVLRETGRTQEAIAHYEEVFRLRPEFPEAHNNLGDAFVDQGNFAAAEAQYREALRLNPLYVEARLNLGNLLRDSGRNEQAVAEYGEALRIQPDSAEGHNNLGIAEARSGKLLEASAEFHEALRLKPGYAEAHYNLALVFRKTGDVQGAIGEYLAALAINPALLDARNNLGIAFARIGHLQEAIAQFEEVIRRKPDNAEGHYNLAIVLRAMKRGADADAEFREAARLRSRPAH